MIPININPKLRNIFHSLFSPTLDFRVRLFNILALGGTVISLIMAFLSLGTGSWGNVLINFALVAVSGGLFLYSYYSGKYQRCYLITIVVIFLLVFPVMFFTSGGYRGGMPACLIHLVIRIAPSAVILQTGKSIAASDIDSCYISGTDFPIAKGTSYLHKRSCRLCFSTVLQLLYVIPSDYIFYCLSFVNLIKNSSI